MLGLVLRDAIEVVAGVNAALWATVVAAVDPGEPGLWSNLGIAVSYLRRDRRPEMGVTHPAQRLDDTVHQRVRLGILAVLSEASRADFGFLRDTLGLTDGNLSRHIAVLEQAGLVAVEKGFEGKRHAHLGAGDEGGPGRAARRARGTPRAVGARRRLKYGQHDGQAAAREYPGGCRSTPSRRRCASGSGARSPSRPRRRRRRGRRSPPASTR